MTAYLADIVKALDSARFDGDLSTDVLGVTHDSRKVQPGKIFVAVPGEKTDGHDFIGNALEAGACAVIAQRPRPVEFGEVPWIVVKDTRLALGPVSAVVNGDPTSKITLVGITGTNGKTTLTFLLEAILQASGLRPGVIGTISYRWDGKESSANHTTPEASDLQAMFADMAAAGITHGIMEVSSHGLDLGRLEGCRFDVGVFTNLTQDHLDYHGTFEEYYQAKKTLFTRLLPVSGKTSTGVVNLDDPYGRRLIGEVVQIPLIGYGTSLECAVRPEEVSITPSGISAEIVRPEGRVKINSVLTGAFNLSNILAAVAVAAELGVPDYAVIEGIRRVTAVPGRLERIESRLGHVFVDYAHTPNALKNVLEALRKVCRGRLITVMGCGGDRDKTKRPVMGREAAALSDLVVITSDNPRTEDPVAIIGQIEEGVRDYGLKPLDDSGQDHPANARYRVIPDRGEAIAFAVRLLEDRDTLLVAGKGHETYQEINGVRYPFDDREVLRKELRKRELAGEDADRGNSGHGLAVHGTETENR